MKRFSFLALLVMAGALLIAGCTGDTAKPATSASKFDGKKDISVISREDGSGTRGAFIELFGIEAKGDDGKKKDLTTKEAIIAKQTDVMMTSIAGNVYGIGYISLGSLNNTVKAVEIDGVVASAENVMNKKYSISRPFNIVTKGDASGLKKDFIDFILSAEGQAVVGKSYIAVNTKAAAFKGTKPSGKLVIAGSSSVTPIMEKLKEAYVKLNTNATVEIQQSDSTAGATGAIDGTCDIGMLSRALKSSEASALKATEIAIDGIAVIVNNDNPLKGLKKDEVKNIFTGKATKWSDFVK